MFNLLPPNAGTFRLFVFGDVGFMEEILLAIAAIKLSGFFAAAGGFGAIVSLLLMMFQSAAKGGREIDLGGWFTGILLYVCIFGPGATLQINSVSPSSLPAVEVPNIPLGIAATASIVTAVGKRVTEATETAFSSISSSSYIDKGGPGRSLRWLASIRDLADPGHTNPYLQRIRTSMKAYVDQCTATAFLIEPQRAQSSALVDVLNVTDGFGFNSDQVNTVWTDPTTGATSMVTCTQATANLNAQRLSGEIRNAHVALTEPKISTYRSATASADLGQMLNDLNIAATDMQNYMFASVMRGVLHNTAVQKLGGSGSAETALWAMVGQQIEQKTTDMVGQEMAFLQSLPSLITFMEALIFCATPFMAFVMLMGRAGMQSFLKLLFIPAFICAWYPTMAVINSFSMYQVEKTISDMMASVLSSASLTASWEVTGQALNALATSSMLMASTPVIALFLLTGGSYVTTALAKSMSGSDRTSEKIASPDATSVAPAHTVETQSMANALAGNRGNVSQLQISGISSAAVENSSMVSGVQESNRTWAREVGVAAKNHLATMTENGILLNNSTRADVGRMIGEGIGATGKEAQAFATANSVQQAAALDYMASQAAGVRLSTNAGDILQTAEKMGKEILNGALWDDLKGKSPGGKPSPAAFLATFSQMASRHPLGFGIVTALGHAVSTHGESALSNTERLSEVASNVATGSKMAEAALTRTNNAEARSATTLATVADATSRLTGSESNTDEASNTWRETSQEGNRRIANASRAEKAVSQAVASYSRPAPEAAHGIAARAAAGGVHEQGLIDMVKSLPAGVQADLRYEAQKMSPGSVDGKEPGSPQQQSALMAVLAANGFAQNPEKWRNAGGTEVMNERIGEISGKFVDAELAGGGMSLAQSEAARVDPPAPSADGVPSKGSVRSDVDEKVTGAEGRFTPPPAQQTFNQGAYNEARDDATTSAGDVNASAPRVSDAQKQWAQWNYDGESDKLQTTPKSDAGALLANNGRLGEVDGLSLAGNGSDVTPLGRNAKGQAREGSNFGAVVQAYMEGHGSVSPAPTERAAQIMAGATIEASVLGGLSSADAKTVREAASGALTTEEQNYVNRNMGAAVEAGQSKSLPGITPSTNNSAIPGITEAVMDRPQLIPGLIERAESLAGEKMLDSATDFRNTRTEEVDGKRFSSRQVERALETLNANGKLGAGAIAAGAAYDAEDEEE